MANNNKPALPIHSLFLIYFTLIGFDLRPFTHLTPSLKNRLNGVLFSEALRDAFATGRSH